MPPEPLEMPDAPENNDPSADSIDFTDFQPFDEEGEGAAEGAAATPPPGAPAPKATPETPPTDPPATSPASIDDPIYQIDNLGQIRASEIRTLHASRDMYSNLQEQREQIQAERTRLEEFASKNGEAIQMVNLLDFPAVRQAMQQAVGGLFANGQGIDPQKDGQGSTFFQQLPPQLNPTPPKPAEPDPEIQDLKNFKIKTEINTMFAELHAVDPEIVTQPFADAVIAEALKQYGGDPDKLHARELRMVARAMIGDHKAAARSNDSEIVEAVTRLEPGARVVVGGRRSAVTNDKPKDSRKMEWGELEAELGEQLYEDVDA